MCLGAPLPVTRAGRLDAKPVEVSFTGTLCDINLLANLSVGKSQAQQDSGRQSDTCSSQAAPQVSEEQPAVNHVDVDDQLLGKTKLCKFFTRGYCSRGGSCTFAHGRKELRPQPNLFRTEMCFEFLHTGHCFHGSACKYAHSEVDLRQPLVVTPQPVPAQAARTRRKPGGVSKRLAEMEEEAALLRAQLKVLANAASVVAPKSDVSAASSAIADSPALCASRQTSLSSIGASEDTNCESSRAEASTACNSSSMEDQSEELLQSVDIEWRVKDSFWSLVPVQPRLRRSNSAPAL